MGVIIPGDFKVAHIKRYFAFNVFVLTMFRCSYTHTNIYYATSNLSLPMYNQEPAIACLGVLLNGFLLTLNHALRCNDALLSNMFSQENDAWFAIQLFLQSKVCSRYIYYNPFLFYSS